METNLIGCGLADIAAACAIEEQVDIADTYPRSWKPGQILAPGRGCEGRRCG